MYNLRMMDMMFFAENITSDDTIATLRQKAVEKVGTITPGGVRFLYNGLPLIDEHKTLKAYGIPEGSTIEIQPALLD